MKTINLINVNESDVMYELTTFPDGEPHIKLNNIDRKDSYNIVCRITNPIELFILMQVGNILKRQSVIFNIKIAYLMSMRMDRVINFNEAFSLEIVADMINSLYADNVYIFECHSERAFKLINNSNPIDFVTYDFEYNKFNHMIKAYNKDEDDKNIIICYPDHGAKDRYKVSIENPNPYICMNKVRDLDNKGIIKSITIDNDYILPDNSIIYIIDDLCDGGGTFCWSYNILAEKYPDIPIRLFVKHMVNPVGLEKVSNLFDRVYITNSYKEWEEYTISDNVKVFKVV